MTAPDTSSTYLAPAETGPRRIRILLADRPSLWRDGLRSLLTAEPDLEVVGEPGETGSPMLLAAKYEPDIVLCDLDLVEPALTGLPELRQRVDMRLLVFTSSPADVELANAMRLGADGVLAKNSPTEVLLNQIRRIHVLTPAPRAMSPRRTPAQPHPLSPRERQLVSLIALGFRNREIADKLFISEQTVKNHLHNVFEKTGIKDRLELAIYAVHYGLYD